jgi:hypothetical protein
MNALGITAGAHRLWTHRSYRARIPLRILLAIFNSIAFQVCSVCVGLERRAVGEGGAGVLQTLLKLYKSKMQSDSS